MIYDSRSKQKQFFFVGMEKYCFKENHLAEITINYEI